MNTTKWTKNNRNSAPLLFEKIMVYAYHGILCSHERCISKTLMAKLMCCELNLPCIFSKFSVR